MVLTALDFLIERKCFQPRTIELFKAVTIVKRDPKEIAEAFKTSTGNVYQAKHVVFTWKRF